MKTQIIIHQDVVDRLIMEYVENKCHEAFEVGYGDRKGAFACENPHAMIFPSDGLVFSVKEIDVTPTP
jgi:hypothetical protein